MRLQITGSRDWTDPGIIRNALLLVLEEVPADRIVLIHGGARGADQIAATVARGLGITKQECHLAEWDKYGKRAGFIRNAAMADLLHPDDDWALAFLQSGAENKGTKMMIDLCKKRSIHVTEVWSDENPR